MLDNLSISFVPLIPIELLLALVVASIAFTVFALFRRARGAVWRGFSLLLIILVLANPAILKEKRTPIKDKLLVIVDNTSSEQLAGRTEKANKIVSRIKEELANLPSTEPVIISVRDEKDETRLFYALEQAKADIEKDALAGVIFVTDGQIHDTPSDKLMDELKSIPTHAILTGAKDETDLAIIITEAPRYGMVGDDIKISVRLDVNGSKANKNKLYQLVVRKDGEIIGKMGIGANKEKSIRFKLDHAGDTVFSFSVKSIEGEITRANNMAIAIVKTIRDRLKVLLISGQPHAGERTWRNLLKSDPSVDLVHFTILRMRGQVDLTPSYELSLIAFPVHELFQRKIKKFDLIIFDRYKMQGVLQDFYLRNIKNYIKEGGGLLVSSGPEYTKSSTSLYKTVLKDALPARPNTGRNSVMLGGYVPKLTELGKIHPVTEPFSAANNNWGRWFRQISAKPASYKGRVLMQGLKNSPLLILDEYGKGRVAWIGSDHTWLWTRGFEGGGPQRELLRRVAHWLMKEPELEENRLAIHVDGKKITVKRRAMLDKAEMAELLMKSPDGKVQKIDLIRKNKQGWQQATINVDNFGLYRFDDLKTKQTAFAIVGKIDIPELQQVVTTDEKLSPYISKTGGGILWQESDGPNFTIKPKPLMSKKAYGNNWLGIKENKAYRVTGLESYQLLPPFVAMLLVMLAMIFAWYKEGKS